MGDALDLMHALVLEDGRRWGEAAADFQREDARAVLDPDGVPYHFLTRGRGGSKTGDLAGLAVVSMLAQLPRGSRLYGLAADRDQGRLLVDSVAGFAERTPELRDALHVTAFTATGTRTGATLEVLAADAPGAWGLRPHFLIVDELAQWQATPGPRRLWEAASTAVAKIAGARMVVLTSAGDPGHWSHGVLEHARADPLWRAHEVPGPAPWLDEERLAEQRRRLPDSSYRRLFLNQWTAAEDRLVDPDALRDCVTLDGPLPPQDGLRYVVAADLGIKRDRTVCVVGHAERITSEDTLVGVRVVLDRIDVWQGSRERPVVLADVEEWIAHASREYNGAEVVLDPWQAVGLAQRLRTRGVRVEEFNFSAQSVGRLASTLHLLLRNRLLALPDDAALLDELANVRLRETSPGVVRMDHDPDRHDDRAVTLALAAHHLVENAGRSSGAGVVEDVVYHDYLARVEEPPETLEEELARLEREREERRARVQARREEACVRPLGLDDPRYA